MGNTFLAFRMLFWIAGYLLKIQSSHNLYKAPFAVAGSEMSSIESVKKELKPWMSSYGEIRYYIDDWFPLVSDVLERYTRDEWMSPELKKIKRAKVWFDESAHVHVDNLKDEMVMEIIRANIEKRYFP